MRCSDTTSDAVADLVTIRDARAYARRASRLKLVLSGVSNCVNALRSELTISRPLYTNIMYKRSRM